MAHRSGRRGEKASENKHSRNRHGRERRRFMRQFAHLRTLGIGALMVGMILAFAIVLGFQANFSRQDDTAGWVHLASAAPADVLTAARATPLFKSVSAAHTALAEALQQGTLGTPVLVHTYHPTPGMLDVWVVPVLEQSVPGLSGPGPHVVALLDFAYDTSNGQIRATSFAGPFVPGDPEYGQPFPRIAAPAASALVAHTSGHSMASGGQPELVYFPVNLDQIVGPHASVTWTAGGQFPDLAVWRVQSAPGQDYVVGLDDHVYTPSQLPLAAGSAG